MVQGVVEPSFVALPRRVRRRIAPVDLGVPVAQPAAQTGVLVLGRRFTKDFGIRFAPIRHNWTYSVSPEALNQMIVMTGGNFLKTIEHFAGIVSLNKTYAQSTDIEVLKQRYLDDWLPALDKGLTTLSIRGTALFLVQLFALGYHFGFSPGFLYYVLFQIANTEGISYLIDTYSPTELSGNSMFLYSNHAVSWLLLYKLGFGKSSWLVLLAALYGMYDFFMQFRMPAASKQVHFLGLFLGYLGYIFFL